MKIKNIGIVLSVLLLAGCKGADVPVSTTVTTADTTASVADTPVETAAPETTVADTESTEDTAADTAVSEGPQSAVTDMLGREIHVTDKLTRIVALSPADMEILYAIGAGDTVVGRTVYCDWPAESESISVVGSGDQTNIEEIIALDPQAVVMTTMAQTEEQVAELEAAGISVIISQAETIDGIYTDIELLGQLTGHEDGAADLISSMKDTIQGFSDKAKEQEQHTVYFEVSPLEWGLWTTGTDTFMHSTAEMLNMKNIFDDVQGWAAISEEQVIERDPEFIVTTSTAEDAIEEICSRPGWEDLQAVKNGHIIVFAHDELTRPGPRITEAIETFYNAVYGG